MGFLHEGHLSLVRRARALGDSIWVSIFVNPTQFGPDEDLERYPRDLERDHRLLEHESVSVVFEPASAEIYPRPPVVQFGFAGLERRLCGVHRPGHFAGVGLVVCKLFNIIQPQFAVFGQKDAQQAMLISRLVDDLNIPVQLDIAATVREPDGLAKSSRNTYLSDEERRAAPVLQRALRSARDAIDGGERDPERVEEEMRRVVAEEPLFRLEYAECVRSDDLATPNIIDGPVLLAIAGHAGSTRLIDNIPVTLDED